jgi:Phage tail protein
VPLLLPCGATVAEAGDLPGDLITGPRQVEFGGLLMGSGTPYRWKELTGWDDMPPVDLGDSPRPSDHGDYPGAGYYQARMVGFTLAVYGDSIADTEELLKQLRQRATYADDEQQLVVRDSASTLWAGGRVVARSIPHQPQRTLGVAAAAVQWKCSSPLRFGLATHSVHLVPGVGSGGLTYPLTYPLDYGTETTGASAVAINDGDAPAPARIVFAGPGTGYSVTVGGQLLKFTLPLVAGDTLTVDTRDGTVLLNDSSDRTGYVAPESVPPELWRIPDGESTISYAVAEGADVTTGVDIEWSDSNW